MADLKEKPLRELEDQMLAIKRELVRRVNNLPFWEKDTDSESWMGDAPTIRYLDSDDPLVLTIVGRDERGFIVLENVWDKRIQIGAGTCSAGDLLEILEALDCK